ncbi:hypothetical protein J2X06_000012 [Lysobacter niastensis]|uniref:Uncharacterized protein n=1 Tax=Lysobacter niastensis TaxID=380629 RepID=A0ABU1W5J3_9GAMM|nr:hypothetical protein [Lysobacter niastensis]MDR7132828.1 hypothetical protein [Lysobacter niastensis]
MAFWILAAGFLLFLSLAIPALLVGEPLAKRRAMGMSFGLCFFLVNLGGTAFGLYVALQHGATAIGRRLSAAVVRFDDDPVVFLLVLFVALALPACMAAVGWQIFSGARRGSAGL